MNKQPTQFQFDCKTSILAIRDYLSKFGMEYWRQDLGWTIEKGFLDHWVEEQYITFKASPFLWFVSVDEDTQFKFLAGVDKRVRGKS